MSTKKNKGKKKVPFLLMNSVDIGKILKLYPYINVDDIDILSLVNYPIAEIEIEYEERSFENFEVIPKLVLKLIDNGVYDFFTIAQLLDLTPAYIKGIINQLKADGQVAMDEADRISASDLGKKTLEDKEGRIIKDHIGKQVFEMDGLNGVLVEYAKTVDEKKLYESNRTTGVTIDAIDGSYFDDEDNIFIDNSSDFIVHNKNVLNSNINRIIDMKFHLMKYSKSFLIKLKDGSIFIFHKNIKEKFVLTTLNSLARVYEDDENIPMLNEEGEMKICDALERQMKDNPFYTENDRQPVLSKSYIKNEMNHLYPFDDFDFYYDSATRHYKATIGIDSFKQYTEDINNLLKQYAGKDAIITTSNLFYGAVLEVILDDEVVKNTAIKLKKRQNEFGKKVFDEINKEFQNDKTTDVFPRINKVLDESFGGEEE